MQPQIHQRDVSSFNCLHFRFAVSDLSQRREPAFSGSFAWTDRPPLACRMGMESTLPFLWLGEVFSHCPRRSPFHLDKVWLLRRSSDIRNPWVQFEQDLCYVSRALRRLPAIRRLSHQSHHDLSPLRDAINRSSSLHTNSSCLCSHVIMLESNIGEPRQGRTFMLVFKTLIRSSP